MTVQKYARVGDSTTLSVQAVKKPPKKTSTIEKRQNSSTRTLGCSVPAKVLNTFLRKYKSLPPQKGLIKTLATRYSITYEIARRVIALHYPKPKDSVLLGEVWLPILGYEGLCEVSCFGRVRRNRVLKGCRADSGYEYVSLSKDGNMISKRVHRLVATAFIPNPDNKPEVNHIDGNKLNNRADNLEWCTTAENRAHAQQTGLRPKQYKLTKPLNP